MKVFAKPSEVVADLRRGWCLVPASLTKRPMCKWQMIKGADGRYVESPNLVRDVEGMKKALAVYRNKAWLVILQQSKLLVVDCDRAPLESTEGHERALAAEAIHRLKDAAEGCWCRTKSGGFHFYFANPENKIKTRARGCAAVVGNNIRPQWIEVKAASAIEGQSGGMSVLYSREDHSADPVEMPDDVAAMLRPCVQKAKRAKSKRGIYMKQSQQERLVAIWCERVAKAPVGDRDNTMWKACCHLAKRLPSSAWADTIHIAARQCGLDEKVIVEKINRSESYYAGSST